MKLRPYQEKALETLLATQDSIVYQAPTGVGKTAVLEALVKRRLQTGSAKVMILVPNKELVQNTIKYFTEGVTVAYSGVSPDLNAPILISTYQSASKYAEAFKPCFIILDECHHVCGKTLTNLIKKLNVQVIGFTATPTRLDGQGLDIIFKRMHQSPSIRWFIENKYLSDFQLIALDCPYFSADRCDNLLLQEGVFGTKPQVQKSVEVYFERCFPEQALFFVTSAIHAVRLQQEFLKRGVHSEFVCSDTHKNKRDDAMKRFAEGSLKILINLQLFVEGVDLPQISNVFMCRFTYSTAFFLQCIGRVLRYQPGKLANIFDFAGNSNYHGSPDFNYDWSLRGQAWRLPDNQQSLNEKCCKCGEDLIHKKYIVMTIELCCMKCKKENFLHPSLSKTKKGQKYYAGQEFDVRNYAGDEKRLLEISSIVLKPKMKLQDKISRIVAFDIETRIKRIALNSLQVDPATIDYYLED